MKTPSKNVPCQIVDGPGERRSVQVTGNAGLYYCCYMLSLKGWNVMPTARNAKGVDIIAYNADASRFIGIQVKTLSKRHAVPVGKSLDKCMGDFWVIVNKMATAPSSYILLPEEVIKLSHVSGKDEKAAFWLEAKDYEQAKFKEAWDRIPSSRQGHSKAA